MLFLNFIFIFGFLCVIDGIKAKDDLVIVLKEPKGKIRGHILKSTKGNDFYAFQEIPYAAPPINENRFKLPKKHDDWKGILNTTENTRQCVQESTAYFNLNNTEDCLFLNIYTPIKPGQGKLPVLFYIHGGSFVCGSGEINLLGPENFMDYGVVIVTINYRLGPFGFLTTGDGVIPSNLGLKDQRFALKWVQKNIHLFSGDPTKVTLWGESAGARSVSYHLLSRKSSDLFRAAMQFSGTAVSRIAYTKYKKVNAINLVKELNQSFNSNNSRDILKVLMNSSTQDIHEADVKTKSLERNIGIFQNVVWNAVIENEEDQDPLLKAPFHGSYLAGNFTRVPLLYGFDSEEILSFIQDLDSVEKLAADMDKDDGQLLSDNLNVDVSNRSIAGRRIKGIYTNGTFKEDIGAFIRFCSDETLRIGTLREAELTSKHVPVYLFEFSFAGLVHGLLGHNYSIPGTEHVGHTEELFFLWNFVNIDQSIFPTKDQLVAARFLKLITNYVKYLNPTPDSEDLLNNITWPILKSNTMCFLNINETLEVSSNPTRYKAYRDILLEYIREPFIIFS